MADNNRVNLRLSNECMAHLTAAQKENNLKSLTAAVELTAAAYQSNQKLIKKAESIDVQLAQLKKYINELRRNNYLIISLLNAITLQQGTALVPMHHDKRFRSPALATAHDNLAVYMKEVMTRLHGDSSSMDGIDNE